jgi:cell surface protein SprA
MLDDDEDTGLDGMFGADPPMTFFPHQDASVDWSSPRPTGTPYDFLDLNRNGKKEPGEPWSYDDYKYSQSDYSQINGTENNQNDGITRYPNTEDINGNSSLDTNNDYYEFTFSLDKTGSDTTYIGGKGGQHGGEYWYLYRIPLNKPSRVVGQPNWSRVEYIRLWMDGLTTTDSCHIAEISLTGNEWKYQGTATENSSTYTISNDSTMTISVVNTHENPGYAPPPGVSGIIDPIQKIESREQSLELTLYNLRPSESAVVEKQFFKEESIVNYRNLKMYVHGGNYETTMTNQDSIQLFLRWGSDTQNRDYYEVRLPVYPGWDERNNISVSFEELSRLKVEKEVHGLESISETIENGHLLSVVGKPSLTNVRWLMMGIDNHNKNRSFTGGVWVDELRVSNVQKEKGMAMRARADIRLSDVISLNGEFTKQDADFHTVNDRFGGGMNSFSGSANSSIQLNKFLPSTWAVSIPVSVNYAKSVSTPKYLPNSDILVDKRTMPDSLIKKNQSISSQHGFNVAFSRSSKSRNFLIRYLVDPIRSSMNYSVSEMSDSRTRFSQNKNLQGSFGYSLSLGEQSYIQPLKWLGEKRFIKKLSQVKLYYLPSTLNIDLRGNQSNREQHTREGISSIDTTATYSRNFSIAFKPLSILSVDFSRSFSSDMRQSSWYDVLSSLSPGDTTSMEQSFSANFDPKLFSFFNPSLRFSSNYRWNNNVQMKSQGTNRSASIGTSLSLNGNFDPSRLIQSFTKESQSTKKKPVRTAEKEEKIEASPPPEKKGVFSFSSIFHNTGSIVNKIEPISISVSRREDRSDNGIVDGEPTFSYQMGFPSESNLGFYYSPYVVSNRVAKRNDISITLRSGLKITSQLRINFDYSFSNSENMSNVKTGSYSKSVYYSKENVLPFPSWSVSWNGLEKLPLLSKYMRVISFSHNFSGKQNISWNDERSKITQDQITKDFRPFAQLSVTFKNGITGSIQYTKTESFSKQLSYGNGKTKNTNSSLSISANYSKTGGIKLPFLKKRSMQNTVDFSLSFESSSNIQFQSSQNDIQFNDDNIVSDTQNWSFKPKLSYRFSNTVTGGTYFELGKRSDKRIGDTRMTAFGINAAISLSGQ